MSKIVLFPVVQRLAQWSPVAVLIPEDISATAVPHGERKFHSFLKILFEARPDVSGGSSGNPPESRHLSLYILNMAEMKYGQLAFEISGLSFWISLAAEECLTS
jgi:hypothetical protein